MATAASNPLEHAPLAQFEHGPHCSRWQHTPSEKGMLDQGSHSIAIAARVYVANIYVRMQIRDFNCGRSMSFEPGGKMVGGDGFWAKIEGLIFLGQIMVLNCFFSPFRCFTTAIIFKFLNQTCRLFRPFLNSRRHLYNVGRFENISHYLLIVGNCLQI
jgi:hypothetical protein